MGVDCVISGVIFSAVFRFLWIREGEGGLLRRVVVRFDMAGVEVL
jgi:hypothetical protein